MAVTLAQGAAFGQDAPPEQATAEGSEILVERERIVDIRAAGDVAKAVAGRPRSRDPLARFNVPLCLTLAIDDPERGRLIGRRIIANARAAGMKIAKPRCRPNALVIIADDMRGRIEEHRRSGRRFFVRLKRHQIDRAMKVSDPVYVFHEIIVTTSSRGRVDRDTRKDMFSAAVMVEAGAAARFSTDQIADYVSLRLLAPTQELNELASGAPRTIMTLFSAPGTAPREMSRLDRAYLAALYRLRSNAHAIEVLLAAARSLAKPAER